MKPGIVGRAAVVFVMAAALSMGGGCAARRKTEGAATELMSAETAYRRAQQALAARKLTRAKQLLEKIQFTAEDRATLEPLVRLALADATFYLGDDLSMIEARAKYLDFVTLFGDHPKASYAQFQAGVCSLTQVKDPSRDQTQTRLASADLAEVERRYPASNYTRAARDMLDRVDATLAEHEFVVGRFYLKRKAYAPAAERFRGILEKYARYPDKQKIYFYLGHALLLGNSDAEGRIYLDKLITDYPESRYAADAKKVLAAASPADKTGGKS